MKVFKFYSDDLYWAYAGSTEDEARNKLLEDEGALSIDKVEEIPESDWDERIISMWEDNDFTKKPFKTSIREMLVGKEPQQIFTNDLASF